MSLKEIAVNHLLLIYLACVNVNIPAQQDTRSPGLFNAGITSFLSKRMGCTAMHCIHYRSSRDCRPYSCTLCQLSHVRPAGLVLTDIPTGSEVHRSFCRTTFYGPHHFVELISPTGHLDTASGVGWFIMSRKREKKMYNCKK